MRPVAIVAAAAESALGSGLAAVNPGRVGDGACSAIRRDARLAGAGLERPFAARAPAAVGGPGDPAAALLRAALRALVGELSVRLPALRPSRVAVAIGTSSGGMQSLEQCLALRDAQASIPASLARAATYFGPLDVLREELGFEPALLVNVQAACASSGIALGLGARWLEAGVADVVIAGGYDAVATLVAAGFEGVGATSTALPAPFRVGRSGMALGEGAALVALVRAGDPSLPALGYLQGFAASSDARHPTAPDEAGSGLTRAARAALADAGVAAGDVDVVSCHATATRLNDAAEARALAAVFAGAAPPVLHPWKAVVGHTLGASAALELLSGLEALRQGLLPAAAGEGAPEPGLVGRLLERAEAGSPRRLLKLSAAFGGANAALVAGLDPGPGTARPARAVRLVAVGSPCRAADLGQGGAPLSVPPVHLARLDPLAAAAVAAAARVLPPALLGDPRVGVVVGSMGATLENDEVFGRRLRERGPRGAEPRRFPATSPNLAAGQCSIALGLRGPTLTVGAGPAAALEALLVGFDLVAAGDAEAVVVVAAEARGPALEAVFAAAGHLLPAEGAAALLLQASASEGLPRDRIAELLRATRGGGGLLGGARPGHPVLLGAARALGGSVG